MPRNHIIYIIGFMGSGKSTAGEKLALQIGWSFIDLDKTIEEHCGMTITGIFSKYGENYFRKVETQILKSLESKTNTLVSTGGGTPCHDDNMEYMIKTGLTIYLKMSAGQLKSRLSGSTYDRPLIKNLNAEELLGFIEQKLSSREKYYEQAEIIVEGINLDINLLCSIIKKKIDISSL